MDIGNLPERFVAADEETRREIINVGTTIYFNGYMWHANCERDSRLSALERYCETVEETYKGHQDAYREAMKEQFDARVAEERRQLGAHYEFVIRELRSQNESLLSKNESLFQELKDANNVSRKIESLLGKRSEVDNAAKGDFGENVVHTQIAQHFPKSIIEDVSGTAAKGDMLWTLGPDLRCLVEVKNVQYVRNSDVSKFERDVSLNVADGSCNCALFVSLKTEAIQGKGQFHFEFVDGAPVVYVSNIFHDMSLLKMACNVVIEVHTAVSRALAARADGETFRDAMSAAVASAIQLSSQAARQISSMRQCVCQLLQDVRAVEATTSQIVSNMLQAQEQHHLSAGNRQGQRQGQGGAGCRRQEVIDEIVRFFRGHNRYPQKSEIKGAKESWFRGDNKMHELVACARDIIQGHTP